ALKRQELRALAKQVGSDDKGTLAFQHQLMLGRLDTSLSALAEVQTKVKDVQARLEIMERIANARAESQARSNPKGAGSQSKVALATAAPPTPQQSAIEAFVEQDAMVVADKEALRKIEAQIEQSGRPMRDPRNDPTI